MEKQSVLEFLPQAAQSRIQSNTGRTFDVVNPATGQTIASVADNGEREARAIADAAVAGFKSWKNKAAYQTAGYLPRVFNLLLVKGGKLAKDNRIELAK